MTFDDIKDKLGLKAGKPGLMSLGAQYERFIRARYPQADGAGSDLLARLDAIEYSRETKESRVVARFSFGGDSDRYAGVLMRLYQTNLSDPSADRASGEKGIIEAISERPRRLTYANDIAGQRIKGAWADGASPYSLMFDVDVDVQMINGKPRAYRIMSVNNVFPIDDEDAVH